MPRRTLLLVLTLAFMAWTNVASAAMPATVWGVPVVCGGGSYYTPATQTITLLNSDCRVLRSAPNYDDREAYVFSTVIALFDIAHEEGHAHDPANATPPFAQGCSRAGSCEAYADCYAAGHIEEMARTFGFSRYAARRFRNLAHAVRAARIGYATIPQRCWS